MQKLFDDQVSNASHDRSLLLGNKEWASHSAEADIHPDTSMQSVDQLRSDQKRMLEGNMKFMVLR